MENTNQHPEKNLTPDEEKNENSQENTGGKRDPKNFHLHIPEEALRFGDEESNSLESFSDSYQKQNMEPVRPQENKPNKKDQQNEKLRDKVKGSKNRLLFRCVWLSMIIIAAIALSRYLLVGVNDMLAVSRPSSESVSVKLKKDCTLQETAAALKESGAINSENFFVMYCLVTGSDDGFERGNYKIRANMDYEAIVNRLQRGNDDRKIVRVTFPEGMNLLEIAERLEKSGVCEADKVLKAANSSQYDDYDFIGSITGADKRYYKLEGYLFPDTYDFYQNENPEIALGKMINTCQIRFTKEMREKAKKMGYSIDEVLTLASIVQAEATDDKDMRIISGILQNRLKSGSAHDIYRLECDSTSYYPYANRSQVPKDKLDNFVSRYDTYSIEGLPPGPICSPGLSAIRAALEPSSESAGMYYFCHDKDGKAYYASTWSQHQYNLRAAGLAD